MNIETIEIKKYSNKVKFNIKNKIVIYISVVGSLLILLMIVIILIKKNVYYQNNLIITSNQEARLNILLKDLTILDKNKFLLINDDKYYYEIKKIKLINDKDMYYQVWLNLNNDLLINSINTYKIVLYEENIFNYIIRIIKGE